LNKRSIYIIGLVTLLLFPLPTLFFLIYFEDQSLIEILDFERFGILEIGLGLQLGFVYALFAILLLSAPVFDKLPVRVENIVKSMNLTVFDSIFLSFCAGFGEEILFRSGIQFYIHPVVTSIVYIAVHGYLNPFNWRMSLYGLILLPFILLIAYGFEFFGLWFAIAAHFMYDLVVFLSISRSSPKRNLQAPRLHNE
jgi:hypothetical protein